MITQTARLQVHMKLAVDLCKSGLKHTFVTVALACQFHLQQLLPKLTGKNHSEYLDVN